MSIVHSGHIVERPATVLTAAVSATEGGMIAGNTYRYVTTYVTRFGETDVHDINDDEIAAVALVEATAADLSDIPVPTQAQVTAKRIYRLTAGTWRLVTELDPAETEYTDTASAATLATAAAAPTANSASSHQTVYGDVQFARPVLHPIEDAIAASTNEDPKYLTAAYNFIDTADLGVNDQVFLPGIDATKIGTKLVIVNGTAINVTANPLNIGNTIDGANSLEMAAGDIVTFVAVSATNWRTFGATPVV